ncbi:hypothetical protein PhiSM_gp77 [Cellulophaga phage phiSM]|nr:hypothetical protein PhiSM_gp77 [Cellulophaga phage phiSM]AGO49396.1 hypothetical protein Phi3:1_gp77 [Cellulophaga phage phi3:1]
MNYAKKHNFRYYLRANNIAFASETIEETEDSFTVEIDSRTECFEHLFNEVSRGMKSIKVKLSKQDLDNYCTYCDVVDVVKTVVIEKDSSNQITQKVSLKDEILSQYNLLVINTSKAAGTRFEDICIVNMVRVRKFLLASGIDKQELEKIEILHNV